MTNRFYDKPYINVNQIESVKINELFNISNNMDTQELLQYSLINKIPLGIILSSNGNNIIHNIILNSDNKKNEFNKLNIIKFLVQNNVNLDQPNINNQTPLHLACQYQYLIIITYLIKNGADINYKDNNGLTPLHYLLSGQIKLETITEVSDFIIPEKSEKKNNLLDNKKQEIWILLQENEDFKNYLHLLNKSIYESLENNDEVKLIITELSDKLANNISYDLNLNEYINIIKFKFKNIIKKMWNSFPELNEIVIHNKDENSYISSNKSNYSMFKNSNIKNQLKLYIKKEIDLSINTITKYFDNTIDNNTIDNIIFQNLINILNNFKKNNENKFVSNRNNINFHGNINNYLDSWNPINTNEKHILANDLADNIINLDNKSFIGGSRNIVIIDYKNILTHIDYILTNYINDINKAIKYILLIKIINTEKYNDVQHILNIINNDTDNFINIKIYSNNYAINTLERAIIKFASEAINLINYNYNSNIGLTIYYNYCKLICNNNINNNLNGNVELIFFRLISAIINCSSLNYLNKSIINSFKIDLFSKIYQTHNNNKIILTLWIGHILSPDIEIYNNNKVLNSDEEVINHIDSIIIDNNLKILMKNIYTSKTDITLIITDILNYYNKLNVKPPLYIIMDLIYFIHNNFNNLNNYWYLNNRMELQKWIIYNIKNCTTYKNYTINYTTNFKLNLLFTDCIPSSLTNLVYINTNILDDYINNNINNDQIFIINKFIESRNLGLYYYGCLPNCYNIIYNLNDKYTILDDTLQIPIHTLVNNKLDSLQIPLPGNFIMNYTDDDFDNTKYFGLGDITKNPGQVHEQYRPAINTNYNILLIENINLLNELLNFILNKTENKCLKDLLKNLLNNKKSLNKLAEIYINFHFNIIKILKHQELLLSFINNLEKQIILFPIDKILNNINNINGYYFTYYYLYYPDKVYKIPKFIYYKLESNYNNKKFLFFNSNTDDLELIDDNELNKINNSSTNIDNIENVNIDFHNKLINLLLNIEIINIENKSYENDKSNKLPPSIYIILPEFFKFNKIKIIIDILQQKKININNDIILNNNLVINDTELYNDYIIAKIIDELILNQANYFTDINSITYITKNETLPYSIDLILQPKEFTINICKFNLDALNIDDFDETNKQIILNFYKLSNINPKINNIFYIYSLEYTNTNLLKQRYILNINKEILYVLLNTNTIKPYIIDNNYNSCIISLLKYHNSDILNELKKLNFNFANLPENPIEFIKSEYKNHIYKIVDSTNKYTNYINNFIEPQYKEIELIILANEKFGNNILSNLKLSFQMVYYIINEYLTDYLWRFNDEYKINNFNNILKLINYDNKNIQQNYLNSIIDNIDKIPEYNDDIIIQDLITDLHQEIDKLHKRKSRLLIDLEQYINIDILSLKTHSESKIKDLDNNINKLNNDIQKLKNITYPYLKSDTSLIKNKIINTYNLIRKDNYSSYLKLWDILLNSENYLKDSWNISQLIIINNEKYIIESDIIDNEQLQTININHNHISKLAESYFNNEKYNNSSVNKVACFIYDTLLHLTESVLCFNIEMILRKVIFNHIVSINPNIDYANIIDKINYLFDSEVTYENSNNNLKTILYDIIASKLVKNSINLFTNINDKNNFELETIKDILNNYFNLLLINNIILFNDKDYSMKILKREISSYFDTIISKTINNWYVVIENTLKFSINQYRINDCLLCINN